MTTRLRSVTIPAALLALLLASGCVSAPKKPESVPVAEADAGSSASTDAESGATASY